MSQRRTNQVSLPVTRHSNTSPSQPLRRGQHVDVTLSSVGQDGRGTAEIADRTLHVSGMLPGDRGWVRVTAVDRQADRAHGVLIALTEPGPDRRDVPCSQHEDRQAQGCTGCSWMAWTEAGQRENLRLLLAAHDLQVDVVHWPAPLNAPSPDAPSPTAALGYRWSAKRIVFLDAKGLLRLGSYRTRSHNGAAMTGCLVDHPTIRDAADELETLAQRLRVPVCQPRLDGLRYVWFKTDGVQVLVTLITSAELAADTAYADPIRQLANGLTLPAGVAHSVQAGQGNSIRGSETTPLSGVSTLTVHIAGTDVTVGPLGFLQPNPTVASGCYAALVTTDSSRLSQLSQQSQQSQQGPTQTDDFVDEPSENAENSSLKTDLALDLYAGAGVTTALLRHTFTVVYPCESWPESAQLLGIEPETTAEFLQRWVDGRGQPDSEATSPNQVPDLIIANPPRAGLRSTVTDLLCQIGAPRLHIMSCSPRSLRVDLTALSQRYRLVSLQAWATLPQTPHVELVAKLELF